MSYCDQLQRIADRYMESGQSWPATSREIAAWAIREGLWTPHPSAIVAQCASELSRAMREDYLTDAQGRSVRAKHAARIEQKVLWADIRTASRQHMQVALQQRRRQIVGDCRQLRADVDSYNENSNSGEPIQMVFDFTQDLEELDSVAA